MDKNTKYNRSEKGRARRARYESSDRGRLMRAQKDQRMTSRRLYIGRRQVGYAKSDAEAVAIRTRIKAIRNAFLKDQLCHSVETLDKSAS